ncbi:hypothetical protein [Couchioplanes azureus]|uniref:hypothetical protein n=1 Tax=Couchioplanes caeruleus TaxID=56438 RepID=UPI001670D1D7|nr:hypothetical protein [Couchioplanes caeruleus]GGQ50906.1 hypothetical protein GCM10010166_19490 [Couchioplanes caeruleus subsp. azureus]
MAVTSVPVVRGTMQSRDLGEVHDVMSRRYVEHRARMVGNADGFMFRTAAARPVR